MKKHFFLLILITLIAKVSHGQTFSGDTSWVTTPDNRLHFTVTPSYPGGDSGFYNDFNTFLEAYDIRTSKPTKVEATFVVDVNGEITDIKITKSGGKKFDLAVIRALGKMQKFIPARMDEKPVSMTLKLPVSFQ